MIALALTFTLGALAGAAVHHHTPPGGHMSTIRATLWSSRRRKLTTITSTFALLACGAALAAWLISATGPGTGKIGNINAPTVAAGTATGKECLPGNLCDASFAVNNTNGSKLILTGVSDPGGTASFSSCAGNQATVTVPTQTGLAIDVPAGASTITVPDAYKLGTDTQQACAGNTFTKNATLQFSTP